MPNTITTMKHGPGHPNSRRGRFRFSLRSLMVFFLVVGLVLSGRFTHPISISFAVVGVVFFCTGMANHGKLLVTGVLTGLGYIALAAVLGFLLTTT